MLTGCLPGYDDDRGGGGGDSGGDGDGDDVYYTAIFGSLFHD